MNDSPFDKTRVPLAKRCFLELRANGILFTGKNCYNIWCKKPNYNGKINMEVIVETKRPWTIKVVVGILFPIVTVGLIFYILGGEYNYKGFLVDIVLFVLLIGIWQGRIWARNLFFIVTLPFTLLYGIASGAVILGFGSDKSIWYQLYLATAMLSIPLLFMLIFLKPSREWFNSVNGNQSEKKSSELSWQFQVMVVIASIGVGFLGMALSAKIDLLPLAKELALLHGNHPTYAIKAAYLFFFLNLSFFIGAIIAIFPLGLILGSWKIEHKILIWRLIIIGMFFPLIVQYFVLGKSENYLGYFIAIFLMNLIMIGAIIYYGLFLGGKIKDYFVKLKLLNKISS
jgi:hypothetical protein